MTEDTLKQALEFTQKIDYYFRQMDYYASQANHLDYAVPFEDLYDEYREKVLARCREHIASLTAALEAL